MERAAVGERFVRRGLRNGVGLLANGTEIVQQECTCVGAPIWWPDS